MGSFRQFAKKGVEKYLKYLVGIKLRRTKPVIIGVTGSFGKTSTKEAIYDVLKTKWKVYRSPKSLNTEIGLLLAVLEQQSGFRSPLKWSVILARAIKNAFFGKRCGFMVLEYGADKPGDIENLVAAVKPHIAVITHIARVHQGPGQFKSIKEVFDEKKKLATVLNKNDIAVLNQDDMFLKNLWRHLRAQTYFFNSEKGIYATGVQNTERGIRANIHYQSKTVAAQFCVPGRHHINVFLPALMIGILNGVTLEEGAVALSKFHLPPGRMSIIPGIHGSTILDSTYNSSPRTAMEALNLLKEFPGKRKIAVIGNMNELGMYAGEAHREVAKSIGTWLDLLIAIGEYAHITAEQALKDGFPEARIKVLRDADSAGSFLANYGLKTGDIILLKGSQNLVRLERTVKIIMRYPEDAKKILCRQEDEWQNI